MKTIATLFLLAATAQHAAASSLRARIKAEAAIHNYNSVMAGLLQADPPADPAAVKCAYICQDDFECYRACTKPSAAALLQANPPASQSGAAASAAIAAAEVAVKALKGLTDGVLVDAENAKKVVEDFGTANIVGVKPDELQELVTSSKEAGVLLTNAKSNANAAMGSLLRLTVLTESMLKKAADNAASNPDGLKVAIRNAQYTFGAALNSCATKLTEIRGQVQKAQLAYTNVQGKSNLLANKVQSTIDNKNGALDDAKDKLRKEAYLGCVASVVGGGPAVGLCYTAALITVEGVKIPQMEADLKSARDKLTNIKGIFDGLTAKVGNLVGIASAQYKSLSKVRDNVMDTAALVVASDDVPYWTMTILGEGQLTQLESTLEAALKQDPTK